MKACTLHRVTKSLYFLELNFTDLHRSSVNIYVRVNIPANNCNVEKFKVQSRVAVLLESRTIVSRCSRKYRTPPGTPWDVVLRGKLRETESAETGRGEESRRRVQRVKKGCFFRPSRDKSGRGRTGWVERDTSRAAYLSSLFRYVASRKRGSRVNNVVRGRRKTGTAA